MVNWHNRGKYHLTGNRKYSAIKEYLELIGSAPRVLTAELVWTRISLPKVCTPVDGTRLTAKPRRDCVAWD